MHVEGVLIQRVQVYSLEAAYRSFEMSIVDIFLSYLTRGASLFDEKDCSSKFFKIFILFD